MGTIGDKLLRICMVCPQKGTAVLKGSKGVSGDPGSEGVIRVSNGFSVGHGFLFSSIPGTWYIVSSVFRVDFFIDRNQ